MKKKEWRCLAWQSVGLLLLSFALCVFFSGNMPGSTTIKIYAGKHEDTQKKDDMTEERQQNAIRMSKEEIIKKGDCYIRIAKKNEEAAAVYLKNEYVNAKITLTFLGIAKDAVSEADIYWNSDEEIETENISLQDKQNFVKKLCIKNRRDSLHYPDNAIEIELTMKKIYESVLYEAEDAYYISLTDPRKVYDKIVVLDPGHGGMDEGTSAHNMKYLEKNYSLQVAKLLEKKFADSGIKVFFTRSQDEWVGKKTRVRLANRLKADAFVSIHCNSSSVGDTTAYGMETLYYNKKEKTAKMENSYLADCLLQALGETTGRRKRGNLVRNDLFILHHAKVPAAIIEIGYMSNKEDLSYLNSKTGRQRIADGIYEGICTALVENTQDFW